MGLQNERSSSLDYKRLALLILRKLPMKNISSNEFARRLENDLERTSSDHMEQKIVWDIKRAWQKHQY